MCWPRGEGAEKTIEKTCQQLERHFAKVPASPTGAG